MHPIQEKMKQLNFELRPKIIKASNLIRMWLERKKKTGILRKVTSILEE